MCNASFGALIGRSAAATLLAVLPVSAVAESGTDEAAVRAAFDAVQEAVIARDVERLSQLVHPDFIMQHALGQVDTRQVWFALVAGGRLPRQTAERREHDTQVAVIGHTGLIRSLVQMTYPAEGRVSWLRATAVFTRHGGRWQQINQQSSYLYDGPAVAGLSLPDFGGGYAIPGREGFSVRPREGYLEIVWASGAVLPLVPMGGDQFASGPTSTIAFVRSPDGVVTGAVRRGQGGAVWWTAKRAPVTSQNLFGEKQLERLPIVRYVALKHTGAIAGGNVRRASIAQGMTAF